MKRTPLYDIHVALGARMVPFAGWEMPLHYPTGINQEHLAVRTASGLFDVSHMGEIRVAGPQATAFLSYATLNDPARLKPGRGQYSMLPNDHGGLIDDLYVYRTDEESYLVICNAANIDRVVSHLQMLAEAYDVTVTDESDRWALLALQGPGAALLLGRHLDSDLSSLRKNRIRDVTIADRQVTLSRTGYTGEDGFEILCRPADAGALWSLLTDAGATPCGLGARDTLRLEAGFPLYGHEFTDDTNPLCSDYAWVVKDKPFYGREAMWDAPCPQRLVGLRLLQRGVARQGYRLTFEGREIGVITSGTISPMTRQAIAMGWIESRFAGEGSVVNVEIRGNPVPATVTKPPFFQQ